MRIECKHYESRTYAGDEVVRKCDLDLAPEAPWRCPANCDKFERRLIDAGWTRGSVVPTSVLLEPPGLDDGSAAAVLEAAENIINAIGHSVRHDLENERTKRRWWRRNK